MSNPIAFVESTVKEFTESTLFARGPSSVSVAKIETRFFTLVKAHQGIPAIDVTDGGNAPGPGPGSGPKPKPSTFGSIAYQQNQQRRWLTQHHDGTCLVGGYAFDDEFVGPGKGPSIVGNRPDHTQFALTDNTPETDPGCSGLNYIVLGSLSNIGISHLFNAPNPGLMSGGGFLYNGVQIGGNFGSINGGAVTGPFGGFSGNYTQVGPTVTTEGHTVVYNQICPNTIGPQPWQTENNTLTLSNEYTFAQCFSDGLNFLAGFQFMQDPLHPNEWGSSQGYKLSEFDFALVPGGNNIIDTSRIPGPGSFNGQPTRYDNLSDQFSFDYRHVDIHPGPQPPNTPALGDPQSTASFWYLSGGFDNGTGNNYFTEISMRRSSFRTTRAYPYFLASAIVDGVGAIYGGTYGPNLKSVALVQRGQTVPNTPVVIPFPSLHTQVTFDTGQPSARLSTGAVVFAILNETPEHWVARTGIPMSGL